MSKVTEDYARRLGYTVDRNCYPWFAYKGPRFKPTDSKDCYTATEAKLLIALKDLMGQASGGAKSCGHDFICICPGANAKKIISELEK